MLFAITITIIYPSLFISHILNIDCITFQLKYLNLHTLKLCSPSVFTHPMSPSRFSNTSPPIVSLSGFKQISIMLYTAF